jgi:DNA helicase II / ATP-dependent DNA helicase PcrA
MTGDLRDLVEMVVERSGSSPPGGRAHRRAQGRVENIREFFGVASEFAENHDEPDLPAFMEWLALRTRPGHPAVRRGVRHAHDRSHRQGPRVPGRVRRGLEESIFPHANSMFDPAGLEEERGSPTWPSRARASASTSRTLTARSIFGSTQHNAAEPLHRRDTREHVAASGVGSAGITGSGWEKRGDRRGTFGTGAGGGGRVFGGGAPARRRRAPQAPGGHREVRGRRPGRPQSVRARTGRRGKGDQLVIRFERSGETKKLLVGYAPIVKIKQ